MKWHTRLRARYRAWKQGRYLAHWAANSGLRQSEDEDPAHYRERLLLKYQARHHTHPRTGQRLNPDTVARWQRQAKEQRKAKQ